MTLKELQTKDNAKKEEGVKQIEESLKKIRGRESEIEKIHKDFNGEI